MINCEMIKELREITGVGMMNCKKALNEAGSIEEAIKYMRKNGCEPHLEGLTDGRIELLDSEDNVKRSFVSMEELEKEITNTCMHRIRIVDRVGNYYYIK